VQRCVVCLARGGVVSGCRVVIVIGGVSGGVEDLGIVEVRPLAPWDSVGRVSARREASRRR